METSDINWPGALVGALAYYALGAAWFTPLFGRAYDSSLGFSRPQGYRFPPSYYVVPLVSALLVSIGVGLMLTWVSVDNALEAGLAGLAVGGLVALPISLNNAWTPANARPLTFGLVTGGYHLVGIVIVAVIASSL